MSRNIRYKPVSKELEIMVKPSQNMSTRTSVGLDHVVGEYYYISINQLKPYKNQARKVFNSEQIQELANSIKKYGVRQPLTVLRDDVGMYEIVSGERRWRAAKLIGLDKVPCIILKDNHDTDVVALIENIHRNDLHPIELGDSYKKLLENGIFESQDILSKAISVAKGTVSEYIKLAALPEDIKFRVIENGLISREKLRIIIKAHENNDVEKIRNLLGFNTREQKNFSILRISLSEGVIKIQKSGLSKLSRDAKKDVKAKLLALIKEIDV